MDYNELASIIDIKEANIKGNLCFDFFRTQRFEQDETKYKNMLYFLNYSTEEEEKNEWCNHFDLREYADKVINNVPNATFVIEKEQKPYLLKNTKYIVVDSIRKAIDQLHQYKMSNNNAKVIGVTGSVGKTTCVGLIERLLEKKYKILRIYSSRITPLLLKGYLLNYLKNDTEYIIMEYAIYAKNHVENLVNILSPDIAVVLNITNEHIGKLGLKTYKDIVEGKLKIFKKSKINFLPIELESYSVCYDKIQIFNTLDCVKKNGGYIYRGITFKPFLETNLSLQQYVIAINIAFELGLRKDEIQDQIIKFVPVEHRFIRSEINSKPITFLGETVHNSRLATIADDKAKNKTLILRKIGAKSTFTDVKLLINNIKKFGKVYVFDDIGDDYINALKQLKNVELVKDHSFIERINNEIVYVYSGYFHTFSELDYNNLINYDYTYKVKGIKI